MTEEGATRLLSQIFDLWINPEIDRRIAEGRAVAPVPLYAAQIVFRLGPNGPLIRINEEVRAFAQVRATRAIASGEGVRMADVSEFLSIELTGADPNEGHITAIVHNDNWFIAWDGRYNAARIEVHSGTAREFLAAAQHSLERGHTRATIDNLHSSVELMAKAWLLEEPNEALLKSKTHGPIQSAFNRRSAQGHIDTAFAALLNRLGSLRQPAKYAEAELKVEFEELKVMVETASRMAEALEARRPRRRLS